ncbi:MAG: ImmA/IrrE family metallo-endopeptidase [Ruegeria sp.]|uniref:ImmA/IrrE family metallo-endopeptidase n=1 Tax=Ruegeria sp. TaxID=1879320 RepID=UPI00349E96FB
MRDWIEGRADYFSQFGRRGNKIVFTSEYLDSLRVQENRIGYSELEHKGRLTEWRASAKLGNKQSTISVLNLKKSANARAIEAHELSHVLLFEHPVLKEIMASSRLLRDPDLERLTDDVARALLLPKRLLYDAFPVVRTLGFKPDIFSSVLSLCRQVDAPLRLVISRIGSILAQNPTAISCVTIDYPELLAVNYDAKKLVIPRKSTCTTKWIVEFTPVYHSDGEVTYTFVDALQKRTKLTRRAANDIIINFEIHESIPIDEIVSRKSYDNIRNFARHSLTIIDRRFFGIDVLVTSC